MPWRAQSSLIERYDAIVRALAAGEFDDDEAAARRAADDTLVSTAMEMLGAGPAFTPRGPIGDILQAAEDIPVAVNVLLDSSCARLRETAARDAGAVNTPAPVARYICRRAIGSYLAGRLARGNEDAGMPVEGRVGTADRATLAELDRRLECVRLADTSCGTGIFLESALDELCRLKRALAQGLGKAAEPWHDLARRTIERNIYGLDIEAYAIKAARARLLLRLATDGECSQIDTQDVRINLTQGNALLSDNNGLLPGKFDVIVGNPPYMRVKSMFGGAEIGDRKQKKQDFAGSIKSCGLYRCQEGNLNLYKLFIERNLSLLAENGSMCLIFPSSFLNETSSTKLRKMLLSSFAVEEIVEIPERSRLFDGVNQATCILTCSRRAPKRSLKVKPGADVGHLDGDGAITIDLDQLSIMTGGRMEVPLLRSPDLEWALLASLRHIPPFRGNDRFPPVGEISVGNVDETIDREFVSDAPTDDIFVKGIHLQEYAVDLRPEGPLPRWVRKDEFLKKRPAAARVIAEPRLIGRNTRNKASSRRLKFAPLPAGYLCGNSIKQIIVTDKSIDPLYLMALLNSSVLNWYFEVFCSQNNIRNYSIEALPILRASTQVQEAFAFIARLIMDSHGEARVYLDKKIMDAMAYELYFMEMRMLSSAVLSSMEEGVTAETFQRHDDIAAIVDRITSREGFKVIQNVTYRC